MSRIEWNKAGERIFETGVDCGVLYPRTGPGVAWNGLISVSENTSGGEIDSLYFDGNKYLDIASAENFGASVEAFSAPLAFAAAEGVKYLSPGLSVGNQPRQTFGMCYRTLIGNDLVGIDYGYKLHLVYNCTASPSGRTNKTIAGDISAEPRSWNIVTVPPPASNFRPTAHIVIDSTRIDPGDMSQIETALYGRSASGDLPAIQPYLPTVDQIVTILNSKIGEYITETI